MTPEPPCPIDCNAGTALVIRSAHGLQGAGLDAAQPLWQRVPTRGKDGQLLADCMFLIVGLNRQSPEQQQRIARRLQETLAKLGQKIVFAELNLKLGLLWVSFPGEKGLFIHIVDCVQSRVPEAKVISNKAEVQMAEGRHRRWWR